jgi:sterol desaturase/sphingolipid hydroxylase (fatty acid hydroxylase superfamily)
MGELMQSSDFSEKFTYFSFAIYAVMIALEYFVSIFKRKNIYSLKDTFVNLITGLFAFYLPYLAAIALLSFFYFSLHRYALFSLPSIWNDLINHGQLHSWAFFFLILCDDLSYYFYHRSSHIIRFFWCIHEVHHSSEEYNFSVYFRASFLEYVFQGVFWIPMILIGFTLEDIIFQMSVSLFYQFWLHTNFTKKIPIFDLFLNVPRFHRVHHAKNVHYLDRNFGAILIIWDRLFGTFQEDEIAPIYGVLSSPNSFNPLRVNIHAFQSLWKDIKNCNTGLIPKLSYLVAPPGWHHDGTGQTTEVLQAKEKSKPLQSLSNSLG